MDAPDTDQWVRQIKAQPGSAGIGMLLVHEGIVRGTSRSGEPVSGMLLGANRSRLDEVLVEAASWQGVLAVRAWVNEGDLTVGDTIMKVAVAGDIRDNVFSALQRLVAMLKNEVVSEAERR
jgi:molybdopterin synthase catalytic subunit